jgi:hypothetical protein
MLDATLGKKKNAAAPAISAALERDFADEIGRIGFHPFVLVLIGHDTACKQSIYCRTQEQVPDFVDGIARVPRFDESLLVRGIERALRREIYDAGDLLYRWTRADGGVPEAIHICEPDGKRIEALYNYPVFAFDCANAPIPSEQRTQALLEMIDTCASTAGNNALRFSIMEAAALALGGALGASKQYKEAPAAVNKGLTVEPYSIHLKAARHTLLLKSKGRSVAPRMEKFAGDDNGYLKQFVCSAPFERFDIGPNGDVKLCCGDWLPTSIGNILKQPMQEVLNSPTAQAIRRSVTDGSYKYCNHLECVRMIRQGLPRVDALDNPRARKAVAEQNYEVDGIDDLMFAFASKSIPQATVCQQGIEETP